MMNWVQRKIYLYNVTFGLYMLDWWERFLFSILLFVDLIWQFFDLFVWIEDLIFTIKLIRSAINFV